MKNMHLVTCWFTCWFTIAAERVGEHR
jgi:hypothetical protein